MSELFTTLPDGTVRPATEAEAEAHYVAYPEQRPVVEDPDAEAKAAAEAEAKAEADRQAAEAKAADEAPAKKSSPRASRSAAKKTDEA